MQEEVTRVEAAEFLETRTSWITSRLCRMVMKPASLSDWSERLT